MKRNISKARKKVTIFRLASAGSTTTVKEHTYADSAMFHNHCTCVTPANALTAQGTTVGATPMAFNRDKINCSLNVQAWTDGLKNHPNHNFDIKLLTGIREGVYTFYEGPRQPSLHDNWPSIKKHYAAVEAVISDNIQHSHVVGPFRKPLTSGFVGNPWVCLSRGARARYVQFSI